MSQLTGIRTVQLGDQHLRPGKTRHTLIDSDGKRNFPPFVRLTICKVSGGPQCYLMYHCESGPGTDGYHENLEAAMDQAEWEFGVRPEEWIEINEPW